MMADNPRVNPAAPAMVEVTGLRKVYDTQHRSIEAIRDVTFTVGAGELVCLIGP